MRRSSIIALYIMLSIYNVHAQDYAQTFPASELQQMAAQYSGNKLNWPLIVNLADHNIQDNTFSLTRSDILQLQNFASLNAEVQNQKAKLETLISSGASIFATDELKEADLLFNSFKSSVRNGEMVKAVSYGEQIPASVFNVEQTLQKNRMVLVQAQLAHKEGNVDKRLGLLGKWQDAFVGDLFKESDGLKTMANSFANLTFVDGSSLVVDPNTVAIIRKSRVDKLDESSDTEISLVEGGLLAKLSAVGKEKSRYILNAGSSRSDLNTQNFYAESDGDETIKLANYDGEANVSANDITITIKKDEGTVIREGEAPTAPVKLLPPPGLLWTRNDTVIYRDNILFNYAEVEDAKSYLVQVSSTPSFDQNIKEIKTNQPSARISDLELGITYLRVLAIDELGLRGPYSDPVRVIRNEDNKPPPVFIENLNGTILFTLSESITISGVTEPDARLMIEDQLIQIQSTGKFTYRINNFGDDKIIELSATDGSGNTTNRTVRVIRLLEENVFNLQFNGALTGNVIKVNQPTVTLSSKAYPGLEVVLTNGDNTRTVQTDSGGRWGITMTVQNGQLSVTFRDKKTGMSYLTKSFTVEAN